MRPPIREVDHAPRIEEGRRGRRPARITSVEDSIRDTEEPEHQLKKNLSALDLTVSALACLWLMLNLPGETWLRFLIWMAIGLVVYFVYSHRHSRLATGERRAEEPART